MERRILKKDVEIMEKATKERGERKGEVESTDKEVRGGGKERCYTLKK